jgi:hypothetical protein
MAAYDCRSIAILACIRCMQLYTIEELGSMPLAWLPFVHIVFAAVCLYVLFMIGGTSNDLDGLKKLKYCLKSA